ncbi:hypothetical protein LCGC14_2158340, partial [marine sediment metagenome]
EFSRDKWADEVWAVNMAAHLFWHDLVFWMDDLKKQRDFKPDLISELNRRGRPIMTATSYRDVCPTSYDYPIDAVGKISVDIFQRVYLSNSIAQAIGYAIHKGVKVLKLYGCDFTYPDRNFAEAGRACVEAWCTAAITKYDMDIGLCPRTSLFDTVSSRTGVYGFAEQPEVKVGKGQKYKFTKKEDAKALPYKPEDSSGVKKNGISATLPRTGRSAAGNGRGNGAGKNAATQDAPPATQRLGKGLGNPGGTRRHKERHPAGLNGSGKVRGVPAPA